MAKTDPYIKQARRAEMDMAKKEFNDAKLRSVSAKTDAEKKKAIKDMDEAAATIARCRAALK